MGELICVCRDANLVTCSKCSIGRGKAPVKMYKGPWQCQGRFIEPDEPYVGLDLLAEEIIASLDAETLALLEIQPPEGGKK